MGMSTNNVSLARIDEDKFRNSRSKILNEVSGRNLSLNTVYVLLGDNFNYYIDYEKLEAFKSSKATFLFPVDSNR
jgi:hypothetical protein